MQSLYNVNSQPNWLWNEVFELITVQGFEAKQENSVLSQHKYKE